MGDAHKRARGGAPLPIPARPLLPFSQPPPSRVPPQFVRDWGHKKGGCAPPPPGAPFAQKRGYPPHPPFARAPPLRTPSRVAPAHKPGVRGRGAPLRVCVPPLRGNGGRQRKGGRGLPAQSPVRVNGGRGAGKRGGCPARTRARVLFARERGSGGATGGGRG